MAFRLLTLLGGFALEITKRDAANRQLNEAIHFFFEQRDPIAIHTLVGSAALILSDLVEAKNPEKSRKIMGYSCTTR